MALQLVVGGSGAGKSYRLYTDVINKAHKNKNKNYIVVVPEQYTMETQKKLVDMTPEKGILNIDVVSFERLAYKVFEEIGGENRPVLDDTGKNLIVRRVADVKKKELRYFGSSINKNGFITEFKSVISEMLQYDVSAKQLELAADDDKNNLRVNNEALYAKLKDIKLIYEAFREYLSVNYITSEEILDVLCSVIEKSQMIRNSVIVFDGFTGFTPIQYKLLRLLLVQCEDVAVTLAIDPLENRNAVEGMENLFYMSKDTIFKLHEICDELHVECLKDVVVEHSNVSRFKESKELGFLEQNLFRQKRAVYDEAVEDIVIYEAGTPKEELKYAIGEIIRLTRFDGYRYGDIAVVTGDIEGYGNMASNMFAQNDIPAFIDQKRKVTSNPMVEMIRSALEVMEKGYSYDSVFRYLRTGMTDIEREDIDLLDNYCVAVGIRSRKQWQEEWTKKFRSRVNATDLEKLNELRVRVIKPLQILEEGLRKKNANVAEYTTALYYFIVEMNSAERIDVLGELEDTGNEYQQIYGKTMELLDKIVSLLGDEVVSIGEYARIIDSGFEEIKVGLIPPAADCVLVGDIQRTRLDNIKVMFFIGVNDDVVPKASDNRSILSDIDRDSLEKMEVKLSPSSREKAFTQRFYLYLIMTKPSRKLYVTYARKSGDGKSILPSYLIRNVKKMYPKLTVFNEDGAATQLSYIKIPKSDIKWDKENLLRTISEGVALSVYGKELTGSITAFESFAACQFAYFFRYGLEINEREEYGFAVKDFGTVLHGVVEQVSRYVKDNHKSLVTLSESERKKLVEESIGQIAKDYGNTILMDSSKNEYLIKRMTDLADRTLWAIGKQLECGTFAPDQFESKFIIDISQLPQGQRLSMEGKIDRIDICEDEENVYVKVIDYKTGQSDFNLLSTYYGLKIQLIMYMKAAMELEKKRHKGKNVVPAGILFYNISDPIIELGNGEHADQDTVMYHIREALRMKGVINSNKNILKKLDDTDDVSLAVPLAYKKDGEVNLSRSSVMDTAHFGMLEDYVVKKSQDTAMNIYKGNVALNPYEDGANNSCKYCPYKEVCGFSQDLPGHSFRRMEKLKDPDIWEKIRGELGQNGESMD